MMTKVGFYGVIVAWFAFGVATGLGVVLTLFNRPDKPKPDPRGLGIRNCEAFLEEEFVQDRIPVPSQLRPQAVRIVYRALTETTTRGAWVDLALYRLEERFGKKVPA